MNPTTSVLAFLMLGVSGVYGQYNVTADTTAPLVPPSTARFDRSVLSRLPSRSLNDLLIRLPGISSIDGGLHIRGSRSNQTGFTFNGFNVLDRYTNGMGTSFIPEATEEVRVHTGFSAGSNGGGHVELQTREGGDVLHFSGSYFTDEFAKTGKTYLNTFSYGWKTAVVTAGESLPVGLRFFVAGEIHREQDKQPMYLEPMEYTFVQDELGSYPAGIPLPYPFVTQRNHVPSNGLDRSTLQWNISSDVLGLTARLVGSVSEEDRVSGTWADVVRSYYRLSRLPHTVSGNSFVGLRLSTDPGSEASVEASIGMYRASDHVEDPDFGESWLLYSDSAANAARGYTDFPSRFSGPQGYSVIYYFSFDHPHAPNTTYSRNERNSMQASLKARWDMTTSHRFSAGIDAEWWTFRSFQVNIPSYLYYYHDLSSNPDSRLSNLEWTTTNIGYNVFGERMDDGIRRARRPVHGSMFAALRSTDGPYSLDLTVREEFIGQDHLRLKGADPSTLPGTYPVFNNAQFPGGIDESQYEFSPVVGYFLPRGSVRYNGDRFALGLSAARFVDQYAYSGLMRDVKYMSDRLVPFWRVPYNLSPSAPFTYLARPEKSSIIEVEMAWNPDRRLALSGTVYRKHLTDQLQQGRFLDAPGNTELVGLVNKGESAIFGVEIETTLSSDVGLGVCMRYAYTEAVGKAPDPSDWQEVTDEAGGGNLYPDIMFPLAYAQNHRMIFEASFDAPPGTLLEGVHVALLGKLLSGHPYTRMAPIQSIGGAGVWRVGTYSLTEPRVRTPVEPYNASRVDWSATWDMHAEYVLDLLAVEVALTVDVTNLFDRKNTLNVYPSTGSPTSDGWLLSPFSQNFTAREGYEAFYRQINMQNRWAYILATGHDMYGFPRQVRVGAKVTL